jgi:class 3 adenylate cyclase
MRNELFMLPELQQKTYLNEGAEEFLKSLKPGTIPKQPNEDLFFENLYKDTEYWLNDHDFLRYYKYIDLSEEYISKLKVDTKFMAFLSIDIVSSTYLSQELNLKEISKLISVFSRGVGEVIYNYNGYVLKYMGDGILAYFPEPDVRGMHDNALYCAYAVKKYIIKYLTPLLKKYKLPPIQFRIGLNSGEVMRVVVGYKKLKQHLDLIGEPINVATKIQSIGYNNSILLGESTTKDMHSFWNTKVKKINIGIRDMRKMTKDKYNVYKLYIKI